MLLELSQKGESFQPTKTIKEWMGLALLLVQNAIADLCNPKQKLKKSAVKWQLNTNL